MYKSIKREESICNIFSSLLLYLVIIYLFNIINKRGGPDFYIAGIRTTELSFRLVQLLNYIPQLMQIRMPDDALITSSTIWHITIASVGVPIIAYRMPFESSMMDI